MLHIHLGSLFIKVSSLSSKCTTLRRMFIVGRAIGIGAQKTDRNALHSAQFCSERKTALEASYYGEKRTQSHPERAPNDQSWDIFSKMINTGMD